MGHWVDKIQDQLLAAGILLAILLVFFARALPPDKVLSPADLIFTTPVFAEAAPAGFKMPGNQLLFDQAYQFTPWRYLAWRSLREGVLPLWNPYSSCGTPFLATMQSALLYPINLLLVLVPFESTFVWSAIIRLWIAGLSTYVLSAYYGLHKLPSLIAAVSFMLCGFLIVWLGHPHTNVAVWLPSIILCAEGLVRADGSRKSARWIALSGILIGIQFTGGHIETSADILITYATYYLIRWYQLRREGSVRNCRRATRQLILYPTCSVLLGVAIGAVQLIPFLEWLPNSAIFGERMSAGVAFFDPTFILHVFSLPLMAYPNIYNNPTWAYPYWSFLFLWSNYNEMILYAGTISLILAFAAMARRQACFVSLVNAWVIVSLLSLGRACRFPIADLLNQLPVVRLGMPERLRLIFSFGVCVLAGIGAQQLLCAEDTSRSAARSTVMRLSAAITALGFAIMIAANSLIPYASDGILDQIKQRIERVYLSERIPTQTLQHYLDEAQKMILGMRTAFEPSNVAMYEPIVWASALALLLFLCSRYPRGLRSNLAGGVLFLLVCADLISFGMMYNPTVAREHFFPRTPVTLALEDTGLNYRATFLDMDLIADAHLMYGIYEVRGMDFLAKWYRRYLGLVPGHVPWPGYGYAFASADSPLLRALGLRYVVASRAKAIEKKGLELNDYGTCLVGKILNGRKRASTAYSVDKVRNDDEAVKKLGKNPEKIYSEVLIIADGENAADDVKQEGSGFEAVDVIYSSTDEVRIKARTDRSGHLILWDTYYPGWKAYVDGTEGRIYRANLAFRSVHLEPGEHDVRFVFKPMSFYLGLFLSCVGIAVSMVLISWSSRTVGHALAGSAVRTAATANGSCRCSMKG
ncbi:MAG: YfhO family protein [Acidobacteria bacterium]|nr:YfhO family protein [Acidobacteriota bacterium]